LEINMTATNWSDIEQARTNAQNAAQTAVDYSARGNTLADELRKAIGERYGQSGIATDTAKARTDFMAAAPQARQDVLNIVQGGTPLSPTQQRAILAASRSAALMPLMEQNLVNDAAFGTIQDLINAGTNAWNAKTQAAQGAAQIAQTGYTSLLNELLQKAQEERAAQDAANAAELFPLQKQKLLADIAATNRSNAGNGTQYESQQKIAEDLKKDARNGLTFSQIMSKYSGKLDGNDIVQLYNSSSKYGPLQATNEEINAKYAMNLPESGVTNEQIDTFAKKYNKDPAISIPSNIKARVIQRASELKSSNGGFFNWIGNLFNGGSTSSSTPVSTSKYKVEVVN